MFSANNCSIVGYNIGEKDILDFAKQFESLASCDTCVTPTTYSGGECRMQKNSYFAHVAVAAEGVGSVNFTENVIIKVFFIFFFRMYVYFKYFLLLFVLQTKRCQRMSCLRGFATCLRCSP